MIRSGLLAAQAAAKGIAEMETKTLCKDCNIYTFTPAFILS
jgi:hypothetical protein